MSSWQSIRLLRARPPQRVRGDDERLAVFVAALEQAEQLMRAAEAVGPAARPLPLFYSLSQAGRAIAAARLKDKWRLAGHGLEAKGDSAQLLRRCVSPKPRNRGDRQDSLSGVALSVGSDLLTKPVELGAIWAAMPDLVEPMPQMPRLQDIELRRPLWAYPQHPKTDQPLADKFTVLVAGLRDDLTVEEVTAELKHYVVPQAVEVASLALVQKLQPSWRIADPASCVVATPSTVFQWSADDPGAPLFSFVPGIDKKIYGLVFSDITLAPGHSQKDERVQNVVPVYRGRPEMICPRVGEEDNRLAPLILWWLLLFGLSMAARYDPELWVTAIDPNDAQQQGVPIEAALEDAIIALPELILEALTG
jgi:hypothetical protein